MRVTVSACAVVLVSLFAVSAAAQPVGGGPLGARALVGTDVNLGLGVGGGVNYLIERPGGYDLEGSLDFVYSHSEWTGDEGIHEYTEVTDLAILGVRVNALFARDPSVRATYYLLGAGVAGISVEWEESSPTDTSLGTPLPGGGSMQSAEGTRGALLLNVGVGLAYLSGFDLRLEAPIFVFLGEVGEVSGIAPTVTVSAGYRF